MRLCYVCISHEIAELCRLPELNLSGKEIELECDLEGSNNYYTGIELTKYEYEWNDSTLVQSPDWH